MITTLQISSFKYQVTEVNNWVSDFLNSFLVFDFCYLKLISGGDL
jgi:hypothetical protein